MRAVGATFAGRGAEDIAIGACRRQIDSDAGGREPTGIDQKRMAIVYAKDKQTLAQALASDGRSWDFRDGGITFDECSATYQYPSGGLQYHLLYIMLHEAAHLFQACLAGNLRPAPSWYNEGSADLLSSHVWEAGRQRLTLSILDKATDINCLDLALREDLFGFLGRLGCRLQTMRRAPPRDIPPVEWGLETGRRNPAILRLAK